MQIKKIDTTTIVETRIGYRPRNFSEFIGQEDITRVIQTAITSTRKSKRTLGHMLLLGPA